jgi:hypothetical protein
MTHHSSNKTTFGLLLAVMLILLAWASSAQAAAPSWSLQMSHSPSPFERIAEHGEYAVEYIVSVENSGEAATSGAYVLEDTPPAQLNLKGIVAGPGWSCTQTEQVPAGTPLKCSSETEIAPGASVPVARVLMSMSLSAPDTVTNSATISGGGATSQAATDPTPVVDRAPFKVEGFTARVTDAAGSDYTVAGGHPFEATTHFSWATYAGGSPVEDIKDVFVELPPGFLGNPAAAPRCPIEHVNPFPGPPCPVASRVGFVELGQNGGQGGPSPIFNVVPERGYPAQFAFVAGLNTIVSLLPTLRPRTGSYGLTISSLDADMLNFTSVTTTFYGTPSILNGFGGLEEPLLSNPVSCSGAPQESKVFIDSWVHPGRKLADNSPYLSDPNWRGATATAPQVTGCDSAALAAQFHPSIEVKPHQEGAAVQADQPTGLDVSLDFPQTNDPTNPATSFDAALPQAPELKDATVALPAGVSISPSSADGLGACSDSAEDPAGDQVHYNNTKSVSCPDSSKLGTVTATTPLLAARDPETDAVTGAEPIDGDIYVLKPHPGDLPPGGRSDGTFRILIQLESAKNGINVKLPGTVTANKTTGQLTATFAENPQLPVSHVEISLESGRRAPLASPNTCGTFTTTSDLVPWSTPDTPDASPSSSFDVTSGPNGSPCVSSPGARPFSPSLTAGNTSTGAGRPSPFTLELVRNDGEQELRSLDLSMPKGFTAKLAGIPYCSEEAIAAVAGRSGAEEQAGPSCSAASQVGTATVGAGPGTNPFYVSGKVYLAGPYKGASTSLVFITPAVAGPFDLGNVVLRAAAYIDPQTAQVTVKSDAVPQILDGVPLRIRRIVVHIDREGFVLNPTDCTPMTLTGMIAGGPGGEVSRSVSSLFQASNCASLKLAPKFSASISTGAAASKARRASVFASHQNGVALHVKLSEPNAPLGSEVNLAKVKVELPKVLPSRLATLQKACASAQFEANPAGCPAASVVGQAKVVTPLLPVALTGPAYFVSHGGEAFPSLTMVLQGYGVTIDLVGTTLIKKGITSTTFKTIPDVPFESFELTLPQGKYSALTGFGDLCRSKLVLPTEYMAQNGRGLHQRNVISVAGCGKALTRAQKLAVALKACKKKPNAKRAACQRTARKKYGTSKKKNKKK